MFYFMISWQFVALLVLFNIWLCPATFHSTIHLLQFEGVNQFHMNYNISILMNNQLMILSALIHISTLSLFISKCKKAKRKYSKPQVSIIKPRELQNSIIKTWQTMVNYDKCILQPWENCKMNVAHFYNGDSTMYVSSVFAWWINAKS